MRVALVGGLVMLIGCGDALMVSGEVFVDAEGTRSALVFSEPTAVTDITHEALGDGMAGSCIIDTGIDGAPAVSLQVADEGSDATQLTRFRALESPVTGLCSVVRPGGVEYSACPGSECRFRGAVVQDPAERSVEVDIDCEYRSADGRPALVRAQLRFTGCTVD
ncbi:MAG: hypothetical protein JJ863_31855 [Deltaproteobacteria bacterium]|nr:hypothetical protein [Deltaproteobacteria bacterium]